MARRELFLYITKADIITTRNGALGVAGDSGVAYARYSVCSEGFAPELFKAPSITHLGRAPAWRLRLRGSHQRAGGDMTTAHVP